MRFNKKLKALLSADSWMYGKFLILHLFNMKSFFSILVSLITINVYSQYYTIKGKVLDASENPIPFATIRSAKIQDYFVSDNKGNFSFTTPYKTDTLSCSHVAFQMQTESVFENDTINFFLVPIMPASYNIQISDSGAERSVVEDTNLINKWLKEKEDERLLRDGCALRYDMQIPAKYVKGQGGFKNDFKKYYDSLGYPKFNGIFEISLFIDKDGNIKTIRLLKGINTVVDNFIINTIKNISLHRWIPAIQNGRNASCYIEVEIEYL